MSAALSNLPEQEVLNNLDAAVTNPDRVPSRTTFGEVKLTFTDTSGVSASLPINNLNRTNGLFTAKMGDFIDQYNIGIAPEVRPDALIALRDLYRCAVAPGRYLPVTSFCRDHQQRWLYWLRSDGGAGEQERPPPDAVRIGQSKTFTFYSSSNATFSDFILATYGSSQGKVLEPVEKARGNKPRARTPSLFSVPPRELPKPLVTSPPSQLIQ